MMILRRNATQARGQAAGDTVPARLALAGPRLATLMFLQFFVWGAWSVTLGLVMQRQGMGVLIADAFSAGPLASILGSFAIGMVAARFVPSRLLLALLHLVGGVVLLLLPAVLRPDVGDVFVWVLFGYLLLYMPSIGLANALALEVLADRVDLFPLVRAFGTIGWIAAGASIGWSGLSASASIFTVAGTASLLLAGYSLTLPATTRDATARETTWRAILCVDAFGLLKQREFLVFIVCATLISIPLALYYAYTSAFLGTAGFANVGGVLALGQVSELTFMFAMPWLYRRWGAKPLLLVGMMAWAARYALFAIGDGANAMWAIYAGILLHGVCYDFFFVAGAIFTQELAATRGVDTQAQGMLTLFTYGLGMLLGSQAGGLLYALLSAQPTLGEWHRFWIAPAIFAGGVAVIFQLTFRSRANPKAVRR